MSTEDRVRQVIADALGRNIEEITDEKLLVEDLGVDENTRQAIVDRLEEEFSLEIPQADAAEWNTVGDAVSYMKKRMSGQ
jgi:acyl carrier protein